MKKDDAIAYLSIAPVLPSFWLHIEFIIPIARNLFQGSLDAVDWGFELPILSRLAYATTHGSWVIPSLWMIGACLVILLVLFVRVTSIRAFFPVALTVVWVGMFTFELFTAVGVMLPFSIVLSPMP